MYREDPSEVTRPKRPLPSARLHATPPTVHKGSSSAPAYRALGDGRITASANQ
ncbi:hypothetical protein FS837_006516, partial [Tulasnella sp. UAMH 9824]